MDKTHQDKSKSAPDWERIELDYRAGIKTLRQIADENGVSHPAITKRAKRDGWSRDLGAKIQAKADELVTKELVTSLVTTETKIAERQLIEVNAQAVADVRLAHRRDIHRARRLTNSLLSELEKQTDQVPELQELGEILRRPDDKGMDKLNDLYQAIISLPERSKTMKVLAESLQKLVDLRCNSPVMARVLMAFMKASRGNRHSWPMRRPGNTRLRACSSMVDGEQPIISAASSVVKISFSLVVMVSFSGVLVQATAQRGR